MSTRWTGSHMRLLPAMFLTEATLTSPVSIRLMCLEPSSLSGRRASLHMRLSMAKASLMARTTCSKTKASALPRRRIWRSTLVLSGESSIMLLSCTAVSSITRTTSSSVPRTSPCFTSIGGKWSCFKWIKQHLQVKRFWGESENAVRIQIHIAIITYCLIAIIEHDLKIGRPIVEIMRILGKSALTTDSIRDLLQLLKQETENPDDRQLSLDFKFD